MTINTKEEFIQFIATNNISLEQIVKERCNIDWDYNAKTFQEMGLDDLDIVEVIMNIEKDYDCSISDEFCPELGALGSDKKEYINPNDLIVSVVRDRKLKELGI
jgi:acyl carrier protein